MSKYPQLSQFIDIVKALRSEHGCPWDREQTHQSIRQNLVEETYEVLDAINQGDYQGLREELGDLLLQVALHTQIADDNKKFDIEDVAKDINEKLIRRHPHVFGDVRVKDAEQVLHNWDQIKQEEKREKGCQKRSVLDDIPGSFPALLENDKISKRVAKKGFDWKRPEDIFKKVREEVMEVKKAICKGEQQDIEEEMGDLLFAVANLCRAYKVNPEIALNKANKKFRKRFAKMEKLIQKQGKEMHCLSFKEWDALWRRVK